MATRRTAHPTQKLADPKNAKKPLLSSHRENIATALANAATKTSNGVLLFGIHHYLVLSNL